MNLLQKNFLLFSLCSQFLFSSCSHDKQITDEINSNTRWRGTTDIDGKEVPFIFLLDTVQNTTSQLRFTLINGNQREQIDYIHVNKDSVFIPLLYMQNTFKASTKHNKMEGTISYKANKQEVSIPFSAKKTSQPRFKPLEINKNQELSGKWLLTHIPSSKNDQPYLKQYINMRITEIENKLIISFDYDSIAFEGIFTSSGFIASSLHKSIPYLIEGTINENKELQGKISTPSSSTTFTAKKQNSLLVKTEDTTHRIKSFLQIFKAYFNF